MLVVAYLCTLMAGFCFAVSKQYPGLYSGQYPGSSGQYPGSSGQYSGSSGQYSGSSGQYSGVVSSQYPGHYQGPTSRQYPMYRGPGSQSHIPTAHELANCIEFGHQHVIDKKELMGLWNVIEVIEHSQKYNDRRNYLRVRARTDSCPMVHFANDSEREVRMVWNDEVGYIQYNFRITNIYNLGFWMSLGYQTGTMVDNDYEHFSGTAQVIKAVQSHMVLTFCSPHERHFSLILSREKHITFEEVRGVHKLLDRLNLPLVAYRSFCLNAGVSLTPSAALGLLLALVIYKHLM